MSIFLLIISLPMIVSCFWAVYFFCHWRQSDRSEHTIAIFFLSAFLLYTCHYLYFSDNSALALETLYFTQNLLVFPLFYLSILFLTHSRLLRAELIPLFLPSVLSLIGNTTGYSFHLDGLVRATYLFSRICFMLTAVYVWLQGFIKLRRYSHELSNYFSDNREWSIGNLKILLHVFGIITVIAVVLNTLGREYFSDSTIIYIPAALMTVTLYALGYVESNIFNQTPRLTNSQQDDFTRQLQENETKQEQTISNSVIPADPSYEQDEALLRIKQSLEQLMEQERPYLNPSLTLPDLSAMLNTNRQYLSKVINTFYNVNFSTFINTYRTNHAKIVLTSTSLSDKEALLDAIYTSGFQSEQSFYRVFKEITGETPLQYRHKNLQ